MQVPVNVLDQRLVTSGRLSPAMKAKLGVEIHARSVLLQGLLLMEVRREAAVFLARFEAEFRLQAFCRRHGDDAARMALDFVKSVAEIDAAIVGVTRLEQLRQDRRALSTGEPAGDATFPRSHADEQTGESRAVERNVRQS